MSRMVAPQARRWACGSRGHGAVVGTLIGSVSPAPRRWHSAIANATDRRPHHRRTVGPRCGRRLRWRAPVSPGSASAVLTATLTATQFNPEASVRVRPDASRIMNCGNASTRTVSDACARSGRLQVRVPSQEQTPQVRAQVGDRRLVSEHQTGTVGTWAGIERRWLTLIAVCGATFMLLVDVTIVQVALPTIQRRLGASFGDLQWVIDAYALAMATLILVWVPLPIGLVANASSCSA
jgi:hypothetical protein